MGVHANVSDAKFPKQGELLKKRARVLFNYGESGLEYFGSVVRDDMEDPFLTLIQLDDGRVVSATECQYNPLLPENHS